MNKAMDWLDPAQVKEWLNDAPGVPVGEGFLPNDTYVMEQFVRAQAKLIDGSVRDGDSVMISSALAIRLYKCADVARIIVEALDDTDR